LHLSSLLVSSDTLECSCALCALISTNNSHDSRITAASAAAADDDHDYEDDIGR